MVNIEQKKSERKKMILQLLYIMLLSRPTIALAQALLSTKSGCPSSCGNVTIPFPFGIGAGCYFDDWFEIDCNSSKPFIRSINLEVLDISLSGTMRVNHLAFGSRNDETTMSFNHLEKSPFFFSQKRNIFVGLGCYNLAYMASVNNSIIGGCFSICDGEVTKKENSCYGRECCQSKIPPSLQVFRATVGSMNHDKSYQAEGAKYAFLVDQQWFETLTSPQDAETMEHVPVVLDWGIFEHSFKPNFDSESKVFANISYKAKSSSKNITTQIFNSSNPKANFSANVTSYSTIQLSVVQSFCKRGYEGNPYLLEGCRDIDECKKIPSICENMICENYLGGYKCVSTMARIKRLAIGIGTGLVCLFLLLGGWRLCFVIKRRINRKKMYFQRNGGLLLKQRLITSNGSVDRCKLFNSDELKKATDNYNVNRILGQGGQGTVYKGMLVDGRIVAVKKSKVVEEGKIEEFINEVVILSQINHRNVVKLLGCCLETEVPILVYEFIPNGTLSQYLYNKNEELHLTWDMRLGVAVEAAGALSYLHSAASFPIYHRDIKSTNILLDDKHRPKIADFGLSRSTAIDQTHVTTKVQGTFGYLDPEFFHSSQFTDKSDVYSFGVVLVELLTGQKPICSTRSEEDRNLATYFTLSMTQNCLYNILDEQVIETGNKEDIIAAANVAKRCLHPNGKKRPTMKEVAAELERIRASRKDFNVKPFYASVDSPKTEEIDPWDYGYTSTSSAMSIAFEDNGPSIHVEHC